MSIRTTELRLMTLADLKHVGVAGALHRASVIEQADGQFHVVVDIGTQSVGLAAARDPKRPRPFRSIDGVTRTLRELGLQAFAVELA